MTTLVAAPYPPAADGLAAFAVQQVAALLGQGEDVVVASPEPSAAHLSLGGRGTPALARLWVLARRHRKVIFHLQLDVWCPTGRRRVPSLVPLALVMRSPSVQTVVHEFPAAPRTARSATLTLLRWAVRRGRALVVFSESQRTQLVGEYGVDPERVSVVEHGTWFRPATNVGMAEARAQLGVPQDACLFVCLGFIAPHKGFDTAIRAFRLTEAGDRARLVIAGSCRTGSADELAHARDLRAMAAATSSVELREGFLTDADFDRWIIASDLVVLPYRQAWSSSVLARAQLLGRVVAVRPAGGLKDQAPSARTFEDERELATIMAGTLRPAEGGSTSAASGSATLEAVQALIRSRAAHASAPAACPEPSGGSRLAPLKEVVKRALLPLTAWRVRPWQAEVQRLQSALNEAEAWLAATTVGEECCEG